jgi:response regulator RpfG family c-di-GMP phosphodiesterase
MTSSSKDMNDNIVFAPENGHIGVPSTRDRWKLLIVDDEEDVHKVTSLVLGGFTFSGREIELISCYTRAEAEQVLKNTSDIAIVLLDVVMEEDDAGLRLVRYIREELRNPIVRIILRTGQPGQAPEAKIVIQYDINDYKSKTELTAEKLITAIVSSLRSYRDIVTIDRSRKGLEKIINASATIFELQSLKNFVSGVLIQLVSILRLEKDAFYCHASGLTAASLDGELRIMAATGKYNSELIDKRVKDVVEAEVYELIWKALSGRHTIFDSNHYVAYFRSKNGAENIVYLERSEAMHAWEKDLIDIFCSNVAIAYENIYLSQELEESQKEIIITLGEIVDNRSHETQNHVKRVGEYCKFIARKFGMDDSQAEVLRVASALHDIGKLAIPDAILQKPGKLTEEEFDLIKKHSILGGDMLRYSKRNILKPAGIIALQHHERFDGSGYPTGIKGNEIHIYSRITAVADVFDALTTDRVYRRALPINEVIEYFRSESGRQFDPLLVQVVIDYTDELVRLMRTCCQ